MSEFVFLQPNKEASEATTLTQMCLWLLPVWPRPNSTWGRSKENMFCCQSLWTLIRPGGQVWYLHPVSDHWPLSGEITFCSDKELQRLFVLRLCFSSPLVNHCVRRSPQSYCDKGQRQITGVRCHLWTESSVNSDANCSSNCCLLMFVDFSVKGAQTKNQFLIQKQ